MRTKGTALWFVTSDLHDSLKGPSLWDKEIALRGNFVSTNVAFWYQGRMSAHSLLRQIILLWDITDLHQKYLYYNELNYLSLFNLLHSFHLWMCLLSRIQHFNFLNFVSLILNEGWKRAWNSYILRETRRMFYSIYLKFFKTILFSQG